MEVNGGLVNIGNLSQTSVYKLWYNPCIINQVSFIHLFVYYV